MPKLVNVPVPLKKTWLMPGMDKLKEIEYQQIVRYTPMGFWACDLKGRILDVNDSYCAMIGYTRQELLGMCIANVEANESPEEVEKHALKVIESGHDTFETRHRCKNGQLIDLEISAHFSSIQGGVLIAFARDISERNLMEAELRKSRAELENVYNNAPCGYHSLDKDGRIVSINQTELDWLGYERAELLGKKISYLQTPSSAEVFAKNYPRFKRDGHIKNIEVDMVRKDGTPFTVLLSATAVYDADGNFLISRTTMVDISEHKQMEAKLRDSEERFRQLFEKAPIGIAMAKPDQKIFTANEAYCKIFGYTQEELSRLTITDLTHPEYVDQTRKMATGVFNGDIPVYSLEKKYVRKGGESFWGRIIATEVLGTNPPMRYVMGIVEDITERVEQETYRLTEINEQKNTLVREVHHRIKNSLQGIVGLLRQHAADHPALAGVIDAVVGKIYSIAVIHGLQAQTLTEEVDLASLMENIANASGGPVIYENDLTHPVFLNRDEAVPVALVLNELAANACKHRSMNGPVTIRLRMDETHAVITITNSFDGSRDGAAGEGQGLHLVRSLLPREFACLALNRREGKFSAELKLTQPVVMLGHKF